MLTLKVAYNDGFTDGWSDARVGRKVDLVRPDDAYEANYNTGYQEGWRAWEERKVRHA